jgi:hypothetical protein
MFFVICAFGAFMLGVAGIVGTLGRRGRPNRKRPVSPVPPATAENRRVHLVPVFSRKYTRYFPTVTDEAGGADANALAAEGKAALHILLGA